MRISVLAALALATTALAVPAAEADSRSYGRSRNDRSYSRPSNRNGYGGRYGYGNRYSHSYRPYRSYGRSYRSYRPYYSSVRPYVYYGGYDDGYYEARPDYYYRRYCPPRPRIGFYFGF
jgi:hypothetical protein